MVQLFVVNEPDMPEALRLVADMVDSNVGVTVAGPVSARSIGIFGVKPGKILDVSA